MCGRGGALRGRGSRECCWPGCNGCLGNAWSRDAGNGSIAAIGIGRLGLCRLGWSRRSHAIPERGKEARGWATSSNGGLGLGPSGPFRDGGLATTGIVSHRGSGPCDAEERVGWGLGNNRCTVAVRTAIKLFANIELGGGTALPVYQSSAWFRACIIGKVLRFLALRHAAASIH